MSMNRVILLGRVGKDPEIRNTQAGDPIASFSLATSEKWRDKTTGEKKESTEWHNVVCFNPQVSKVIESYVHKGDMLGVEGKITSRKYEKDGQTRYVTEIVIGKFDGKLTLVGGGKRDEAPEKAPVASGSYASALEDDIPFGPFVGV